jgi:hypothetical protein
MAANGERLSKVAALAFPLFGLCSVTDLCFEDEFSN